MKINNKFLIAAIKTILLGASLHLFLLTIYALINQNLETLNIFNILDFDLFIPQLSTGLNLFLLSYLVLGTVFFIFVALDKNKK